MPPASLDFVDALDESPTVLLSLAGGAPFRLRTLSMPAPDRRRNWASSMLTDGQTLVAEAFENRRIDITVELNEASEDASSMQWGTLARLLAAPRWLRYTPRDSTRPVFFRTHAQSPSEIDDLNGAIPGTKRFTLEIPADPFAYGLPESIDFDIHSDPQAGDPEHGITITLDDIKGDVPAPLRLRVTSEDPTPGPMVATTTDIGGFSHTDVQPDTTPPGWTLSTVSDPTAINGSYSRYTTAAGTGGVTIAGLVAAIAHPGEYRVLLRLRAGAGAVATVSARPLGTSDYSRPTPVNNGWAWHDMGVMRLPANSRQSNLFEPSTPTGAAVVEVGVSVTSAPAGARVEFDWCLLIPAPGRDDSAGALLIASEPFDGVTYRSTGDYVISGEVEGAWESAGVQSPLDVVGGFPRLVPGVSNLLVYVHEGGRRVVGFTESIDAVASLEGTYYPRYLYLRGD